MARVVLGMLGFGTVGTGVVRLLSDRYQSLVLKKVAVRDTSKERRVAAPCAVTDDPFAVVDDPEIEVVIEVMGGEQPALELITRAIERRKHIVTANKELLAKHGPDLFALARKRGVAICFEASVAGGIPLIATMHKGLEANKISSLCGILNGTTNFILSSMEDRGEAFADALKKAQDLGFAEADPTADIEGYDVAYKLSILTALGFGRFARTDNIARSGITKVDPKDFKTANEFGYRIKLLGKAVNQGNGLCVRVEPTLVPLTHPLAAVSGSNNGIVVHGDAVGQIMMIGPGAGEMPTASAVVGDVVNLSTALQLPDFASYFQAEIEDGWAELAAEGDWQCPYYLRMVVRDHPGVIGQIGTIFGRHNLSISSIVQRPVSETEKNASIIIITHTGKSGDMTAALNEISSCEFLENLAACMPIYEARHA
ncbi:MAG: homoserine dehydrogenase [Candidatus Obscuribacterales bacterium]|nr:homoserine dehydrogenase [Candidatus Obscuribacterales bacterium]